MLKANNLTGSMKVGDGAATNFENNFFDVIWGSAVLHHLDHQKFSEELNLIIKSDVHGSSEAIKNAISQIKIFI